MNLITRRNFLKSGRSRVCFLRLLSWSCVSFFLVIAVYCVCISRPLCALCGCYPHGWSQSGDCAFGLFVFLCVYILLLLFVCLSVRVFCSLIVIVCGYLGAVFCNRSLRKQVGLRLVSCSGSPAPLQALAMHLKRTMRSFCMLMRSLI